MNKIINGKQLTLMWHVDDIKILHINKKVVSDMIVWLKSTYECIFEDGSGAMKVSHRKLHDYLRMQLDFSSKDQILVTMVPYIQAMLDKFSEHDPTKTTAKTLAANHLFQINDKVTPLSEKVAAIFHTFVAKVLFLTKQACPDFAMVVAFLTTHVTCSNQDDRKKLHWMM